MEFAERELRKYGWKSGEGLGKNGTGAPAALKPKLKFDRGGIGFEAHEDPANTWWQRLYDEAASNIATKVDSSAGVVIERIREPVEITTQERRKRKKGDERYGNFVKTARMTGNSIERFEEVEEAEGREKVKKRTSGICELTDEELFKACGGRTGHKGARHGLEMNAKLARLEAQEKSMAAPRKKKKKKDREQ